MANEEHLAILKQGVEVWNKWREEDPETKPDLNGVDLIAIELSGIDLSGVGLTGAELSGAQLGGANLRGAELYGASFIGADLIGTELIGAELGNAELSGANLSTANLTSAELNGAELRETNLSRANLDNANMSRTNLSEANLSGATLNRTDLSNSICLNTIFGDVDLSTVKGLGSITHLGRSIVGVDTLFKSQGKLPEIFLRGCGVPENLITYLPSFLEQAIQFYSCFISYSHDDAEFARRLHDRLQGEGIRCWLDAHQLNPGDPLHPTIYEAIRVYDKVLLCCSETALKSWWVEKEFNRVIRKEEDYRDKLLIPLNLDGYLFTPECEGWIADEVKQRLAADFTGWKDHDGFEKAFKGVIKALRTDGGKAPPPEPKLKPKK